MMLLRTLVLERNDEDKPVNGALLCAFAVAQTESNFLVYSLDEEAEPGHSRVYIAELRKKLERYFLGGVDSKEDLQAAMQVFKQILMLAAATGSKTSPIADAKVPFHFIDLKGCRLPPARPEDHHSVIIKKALVMKVITLGMSAPALPAIESNTVIVPSIRFSSQMVAPPRNPRSPKAASQSVDEEPIEASAQEELVRAELAQEEFALEEPAQSLVAISEVQEEISISPVPFEQNDTSFEAYEPEPPQPPAQLEHTSLLEMDSALSNLAKVAQELTQKKCAVLEKEAMLEQWQARLQQQQSQLDEKSRELELRHTQLQDQGLEVSKKAEKLAMMMLQLSGMRQRMQGTLLELDQVLEGQG
ncbi:hypothetical protein SAMN05216475_3537 [Pseudomonas synxantha]|uniref:Chromosome segregation ATPase n=1 Tax=Pseudomonas synxantha TaxID=47883 RepID=A0AAX3IA09_9PSED|nr:hypothetical protein [Pseudomonas synxantha]AZE66088.1 hypothetical protein C4K01_1879 [Pseudomonas synxantha]KRP57110.1 hypothetical protein TU77_05790 [Pseudomonas synxantha]MBI6567026.1 hypothetical protein [Pseudomonas synxantha]MBI6583780.1 hypothetical protein [Pseudomonas synxantha]MBI6645581.1 hypothetical protein [Pseudomonas synxantha]